jgi:predicted MPP superfamily phosphohydrolase
MRLFRVTRRRFLAYLAAGGLGVYAWRIEPHWVEVVERDLPIEYLPGPLEGKRLIQLSDLHVGPRVDDDYLIGALQRVNALAPDILALTGDFMTEGEGGPLDRVARVVEHLRPARLATLAILGNHDYGAGWANADLADRLVRRLEGLGIEVLRNAVREVEGLQVAGLDDLWGPHFNPFAVLARLDPDRARLVLCHNPDAADEPIWPGYRGWILSGHTHGGQCKPPFLPPPLLPVKNRRYVAGEIDLGAGRRLYINRALGYLRRVRFNVRPEITVFTLQRA